MASTATVISLLLIEQRLQALYFTSNNEYYALYKKNHHREKNGTQYDGVVFSLGKISGKTFDSCIPVTLQR
jgi:hypothetical protein